MSELRREIETAINHHCAENGSNTPDFILAEYLTNCLAAFDTATRQRERWNGRNMVEPGSGGTGDAPVDREEVSDE